MDLYRIKKGRLVAIGQEGSSWEKEKQIQSLIEENLDAVLDLLFVSSEMRIGKKRIDTLAFDYSDPANKTFVAIEYKKSRNISVVDQAIAYWTTMQDNKGELVSEFNEKHLYKEFQSEPLKRGDVAWDSARVIIISTSFTPFQKESAGFRGLPIELWTVGRFDGNLVSLERHETIPKESTARPTKVVSGSDIDRVSSVIPREKDHVEKLSAREADLWDVFKERMLDMADVSYSPTQQYVGFRKGSKVVCRVSFGKGGLHVVIPRGNKSKQGEASRNFFDLKDDRKLARQKSWKWKNGKIGHLYEIPLHHENLERVLELIEQKYNSLR